MEITNARYVITDPSENVANLIEATIDGEVWDIPLTVGNRHYDEIMRQVEAGELTIQDAE